MRRCRVGMEPHPTICDFGLTKTPIQRLKEIRAKGGKIPQDLQLRLRAMRLRKLRASTKAINRRRESQQLQNRRARSARAWRAWESRERWEKPESKIWIMGWRCSAQKQQKCHLGESVSRHSLKTQKFYISPVGSHHAGSLVRPLSNKVSYLGVLPL